MMVRRPEQVEKPRGWKALNIAMVDSSYNKEISYRTPVQTYGWQKWVNGGKTAEQREKLTDFEAIQIEFERFAADQYAYILPGACADVWLAWAKRTEKRPERKVFGEKIGSYSDRTGGKRWSST